MSLWSKFSKPMCHWKVMVETRVTEEVDVDEKDGMVVAKVEEEEATMTIQLMKRQVIIHPGANGRPNEKRYDKSHIEFFNAHKFGHYALKCCYDTNGVEERANFVDKEEGESKPYCWHSKMMKRMTKIHGTWMMEQAITRVTTKKSLWSLMRR